MKVTLDCDKNNMEDEIVIRCAQVTDNILKIISLANAPAKKLTGSIDRQVFVLESKEIYYFESVDDKVYICTKDKVYDCALKLYEIEKDFPESDFLRANKSTIINLAHVKSLNPLLNGRIEVELENGEKQIISRQYAPVLKTKLGIGR